MVKYDKKTIAAVLDEIERARMTSGYHGIGAWRDENDIELVQLTLLELIEKIKAMGEQ